jgi:hypothetical protein
MTLKREIQVIISHPGLSLKISQIHGLVLFVELMCVILKDFKNEHGHSGLKKYFEQIFGGGCLWDIKK